MEALMDFSVAINLEQKLRDAQREGEKNNGPMQQQAARKFNIDEYYRNAGQANFELAQYT